MSDNESELERKSRSDNPYKNKFKIVKSTDTVIFIEIESSYNENFKEGDILELKLEMAMIKDKLEFKKIWEGYGVIVRIKVDFNNNKKQVEYKVRIPYVHPIHMDRRQVMFTQFKSTGYLFSEIIE